MGKNGTNTVDPNTGTITYSGTSESVPSSHKGMPPRTDAYEPTDERGHIQASSLSGPNTPDNVVPQSKDLNHGAYLQMENAERSIDKSGGKVESEKSAFVSNQRGGRPDAFMVNDHVTYANGHEQTVHLSFANLTNEQQESMNQALNAHTDMLNAPNPGDTLRESMSTAEYSQLMEETESYLPSVKEMYDPGTIFADLSQPEAQATLESSASGAGAQNGGLDGTGAAGAENGGLAGAGTTGTENGGLTGADATGAEWGGLDSVDAAGADAGGTDDGAGVDAGGAEDGAGADAWGTDDGAGADTDD